MNSRATRLTTIHLDDVQNYVYACLDRNPIYTSDKYARSLGFSFIPIPDSLLTGIISGIIGTELPGEGLFIVEQKLKFPSYGSLGDPLEASVEVIETTNYHSEELPMTQYTLKVEITQDKVAILTGEMVVQRCQNLTE
jgi:acyl dehydratase